MEMSERKSLTNKAQTWATVWSIMYGRNCATDEDNTNNQEETLQTNKLQALTSLQLLVSGVFTCFRFAATLNMLLCLSLCIRVITSIVVNVPTFLAVGAHKLTFPFVHDFTNGYFQEQEIDRILRYRSPAEGIPEEGVAGGSILASRVPIYGTKDAGRGIVAPIEQHLQTVQILSGSNSADSVHSSKPRIKNHCRVVFQCRWLAVWLSPGRSRCHTILGWQRRGQDFQILWERVSTRRRLWYSCHDGRSLTTRNMVWHERLPQTNYSIEIRHTISCLDCKTDTILIFHTAFRRYKARSKMHVFETCVSASVLWNMPFLRPHVHLLFSSFLLGWCSCCDGQWCQFLPRTRTSRRDHSKLQIAASLYHSTGAG